MRAFLIALIAALALSTTACGSQQQLAEEAFTTAETSYAAIRADARTLVPAQAQMIEEAFAAAQADLDREDYREATFKARALPDRIAVLAEVIARRKAATPQGASTP